jgi:hypothetical protein
VQNVCEQDLSSAGTGGGFAFRQSVYTVSVMENVTESGTLLVVHTVGSQLGEHVTYRLLNTAQHWFTLGGVSGELRTTGTPLDRERTPNVTLVVQAIDRRVPARRAQSLITITVADVNDCAPMFLHRPYIAVVPLDAKVGDNVTHVLARDDDDGENGRVTYVCVGFVIRPNICRYSLSKSDHFTIDNDVIKLAQAFGKNTENEYKLQVTARDHGECARARRSAQCMRAQVPQCRCRRRPTYS